MNNKNPISEEFPGEEIPELRTTDKRRFSPQGERIREIDEDPKPPVRSMKEAELEAKLAAETERREAAEAKLVGVQAKFEEAKAEIEADTAQMRARMIKTLEERAKQGQSNFLMSLLPVLDNLNLAVAASEKDTSFEHLLEGVKGTARSFEQALQSVGVEAVPSIGAEFDPEVHEAIDMAEVDAEQEGKVTAEYSRGYKFGDRLLRAARVQVGKAKAQSAGE